jgi:hypothetical protein
MRGSMPLLTGRIRLRQHKCADISRVNEGARYTQESTFAQTVSRPNTKFYINQTLVAMGVFLYFEGGNGGERGRGISSSQSIYWGSRNACLLSG